MAPDSPRPPSVTPAVGQHEFERSARCTNCDAVVSGEYCSACGQLVKYRLHSFLELFGEVTEVLTHSDSRLWRTLRALLFRPGFLTQQFLAGRRASYLSPFRLYFAMSVIFFLVVSIIQTDTKTPTKALASIPSTSIPKVQSSAEELCERAVGHSLFPGADKLREPFVAACIKSQADHGRELRESFIHNLGRAMFLLLPLMAVFMELLYRRPAYSYITHLLLLLHYQALVFLLMSLALVMQRWIPLGAAGPLLPLLMIGYVSYYLYRAIRLVYVDSPRWTLLKCSTVLVVYLGCGVCTILLAGLYSVERLR
jgi:Protein of unknown function (DUF3667)